MKNHLAIFFDKNGLSMSDANHVCNMAKEWAKEYESLLDSLQGKKRTLDDKVLSDPTPHPISNLEEAVKNIAQLYRVSAWLREAIKAKNEVMEDIRNKEFYPVPFNEPRPNQQHTQYVEPNQEDILSEWSFKDRFEYLSLEAEAAHIGKQIHGGNISRLRGEVLDKTEWRKETLRLNGQMSDVFVKMENVYESETVSKLFFDLQKEHRAKESRLNYFKARIQNELAAMTYHREQEFRRKSEEAQNAYQKEVSQWELRRDKWNAKNAEQLSQHKEETQRELNEASQLKIAIPEELRATINDLK